MVLIARLDNHRSLLFYIVSKFQENSIINNFWYLILKNNDLKSVKKSYKILLGMCHYIFTVASRISLIRLRNLKQFFVTSVWRTRATFSSITNITQETVSLPRQLGND